MNVWWSLLELAFRIEICTQTIFFCVSSFPFPFVYANSPIVIQDIKNSKTLPQAERKVVSALLIVVIHYPFCTKHCCNQSAFIFSWIFSLAQEWRHHVDATHSQSRYVHKSHHSNDYAFCHNNESCTPMWNHVIVSIYFYGCFPNQ